MPRIRPPPGVNSSALPHDTACGVRRKRSAQIRMSSTSSSVYPNSTHTLSPSESSASGSPRSPESQLQDNHAVSSFDPDGEMSSDFDGDDVSYRLRLLVKNSYFLPPAHSKPLSSDLTSPLKAQKQPSRAATPTFLDLFRLGKSKSRPSTASSSTTAVESNGPVLRTASDTTMAGRYAPKSQLRSMHPRGVSQPFHHAPSKTPAGRVVVVREIMDDLIVAAKEAERDIKVREWRNSQDIEGGYEDHIDPTDAVDLPQPSAGYPFAVQSTAAHGLGVEQSVSAADLAERLIPPASPHSSSLHPPDDAWRRALLHEAIGHSLNASPAESVLSTKTSSLAKPNLAREPLTPSSIGPSKLQHALDQKIISHPVQVASISDNVSVPTPRLASAVNPTNRYMRRLSSPDVNEVTRRLSYCPQRAESPAHLHTPLAPPPRSVNPSLFHTRQSTQGDFDMPPSSTHIRKAKSSPSIPENRGISVPPIPSFNISLSPEPIANQSLHLSSASASTASSYYTDDRGEDEWDYRPSMTVSTTEGRPSYSEFDRPSPAVSAFGDGRHSAYLSSSPIPGQIARELSDSDAPEPTPRSSTLSPPPRTSSSPSNAPLLPPPRKSSLHYRVVTTRITPTPSPSISPVSTPGPSQSSFNIVSPQQDFHSRGFSPTLPVSPGLATRRGNSGPTPLMLNANTRVPVAVHSAPPPASPASFFDNIQDGMHDLDDSSESDEDEDAEQSLGSEDDGEDTNDADLDTTLAYEPLRARAYSNLPSPRSPLTQPRTPFTMPKFRNQSTPNVARPPFSPSLANFSPTLARFRIPQQKRTPPNHQPVSNIPPHSPTFFASKKSGISPRKSPLEFVHNNKSSDDEPLPIIIGYDSSSSASHPTTESNTAGSGQKNQSTQDESLRKLDGLMVQHMEAEKDRMKKIARTLQESNAMG